MSELRERGVRGPKIEIIGWYVEIADLCEEKGKRIKDNSRVKEVIRG